MSLLAYQQVLPQQLYCLTHSNSLAETRLLLRSLVAVTAAAADSFCSAHTAQLSFRLLLEVFTQQRG